MITDPDHAIRVRDRILDVVDDLFEVYFEELEASAWPERVESVPTSGGSIGDPTADVALAEHRTADADRLLRRLERLEQAASAALTEHREAVGW